MQSVTKREKLGSLKFCRNYSDGKNVAFLQCNVLAASGKRNGPSSFVSLHHWLKSCPGISSKTQWNQWEPHYWESILRYTGKKEQIEIVSKNIELLFWKCSEFSFQRNKGRNYLKFWFFRVSFQEYFLGWSLLPGDLFLISYHWKKRGITGWEWIIEIHQNEALLKGWKCSFLLLFFL